MKNLTANLGLRYEHNNLPVTESQLEPRVGLAYYIPSTGTVLRATYNRVLFTPEYENILLELLGGGGGARAAGGAGLAPARRGRAAGQLGAPERVHRRRAAGARLEAAPRRRLLVAPGDERRRPGPVPEHRHRLPARVRGGQAQRLGRAARPRADARDSAASSRSGHVHAIYVPPPVGGLFLDQEAVDAITGGPFLIDHDQKLQIQAGIFYDIAKTGLWLGTNVRYDSGLVTDASPEDLLADPDNAFAAPFVVVHSGTRSRSQPNQGADGRDFSVGVDLAKYHIPAVAPGMILNAFDRRASTTSCRCSAGRT